MARQIILDEEFTGSIKVENGLISKIEGSAPGPGGETSIEFHVIDSRTRSPVEGASVRMGSEQSPEPIARAPAPPINVTDGKGRVEVRGSPGPHMVTVTKKGYVNNRKEYIWVDGKKTVQSVSLDPESEQKPEGSVRVSSMPSGAKIYISGGRADQWGTGITPDKIKLDYGEYVISVRKEGFVSEPKKVTVRGDEEVHFKLNATGDLTGKAYELTVKSIQTKRPLAGVKVEIPDLHKTWSTDMNGMVKLDVRGGLYQVLFSKDGFNPFRLRLNIREGGKKTVEMGVKAGTKPPAPPIPEPEPPKDGPITGSPEGGEEEVGGVPEGWRVT